MPTNNQQYSSCLSKDYIIDFVEEIKRPQNLKLINLFGETKLIERIIEDMFNIKFKDVRILNVNFRVYRNDYNGMIEAIRSQTGLDEQVQAYNIPVLFRAIREKYKKSAQFIILIIQEFDYFFENLNLDPKFDYSFESSLNTANNSEGNAILILSKKKCEDRVYIRKDSKNDGSRSFNVISRNITDFYKQFSQEELEKEIIRKVPKFKNQKDITAKLASFLISKEEYINSRLEHFLEKIPKKEKQNIQTETLEKWDKEFIRKFPFQDYKEETHIIHTSKKKMQVYKRIWLEFKDFCGINNKSDQDKPEKQGFIRLIIENHLKKIIVSISIPIILFIFYQLISSFVGQEKVDTWWRDFLEFKENYSKIINPSKPSKEKKDEKQASEAKETKPPIKMNSQLEDKK